MTIQDITSIYGINGSWSYVIIQKEERINLSLILAIRGRLQKLFNNVDVPI